ncbi:MAG: J domain-containing protein [Proteobacteria bacterium]|nr:J domain-containing protein [Burkholderiales bacterium]
MIPPSTSIQTHYEVLRVAPDASGDEVRTAYRRLSRRFHPDRHPRHVEAAARIMASINVAYDVLSDGHRRADYDHALRAEATPRSTMQGAAFAAATRSSAPRRATADPAPFFGTHRNAIADHAARRRMLAVRRLVTASALFCAAGLLIGAWMAITPYVIAPTVDVAAILDARDARRAGVSGDTSRGAARAGQDSAYRRAQDDAEPALLEHSHVRPLESPNGSPWPSLSGELGGYARRYDDGTARLMLDNRMGPSDVFAKVYRLTDDGLTPARHVFVRAREQLALERLRAGAYEVRYLSLDSGQTSRSERLVFDDASGGMLPQSFRLDDMLGRSGRATPIPREDFQMPALRLKLSQEPTAPATTAR